MATTEDQSSNRSNPAAQAPLRPTEDLNVVSCITLTGPAEVKEALPMTGKANDVVVEGRETIKSILTGQDPRMLAVVGPCSIHDEKACMDYAQRLARVSHDVADKLYIVMRVYFEKPRTTVGWKGLINDPHLDGSFDMEAGIRLARKILLEVNHLGLAAGTEVLDPITPQYIADLVTWAAIGARTIESQTHRQMASGLSMPIGYKNATGGELQIALDAMKASGSSHSFLGIDDDGKTAIVQTRGNQAGHLILRGGRSGPNYAAANVAEAVEMLAKNKLPTRLMVDCSHANSNKKYQNQENVWREIVQQRVDGNKDLMGLLVESNLGQGNQAIPADLSQLQYGVSITDECLGWEKTEEMIRWAHKTLPGR